MSNDDVIKDIEDVTILAEPYHGKIYGEYVRNVIVPGIIGKTSQLKTQLDIVDIWFRKQGRANQFILTLCKNKILCKISNNKYQINYSLILQICVSPKLPKEFDLDSLIYYYNRNLHALVIAPYDTGNTALLLKNNILEKKITMLTDYYCNLVDKSKFINKINNLISDGWTVKTQDNIILIPSVDQYILDAIFLTHTKRDNRNIDKIVMAL